jgi:hypothetical protein
VLNCQPWRTEVYQTLKFLELNFIALLAVIPSNQQGMARATQWVTLQADSYEVNGRET